MENEFIPYEQALELKKLGFNEACIGYYNEDKKIFGVNPSSFYAKNSDVSWNCKISNIFNKSAKLKLCTAPLYQQAFRWLYQKLDIEKGVMPLDTESQKLLLKELIDKVSSKHLLV